MINRLLMIALVSSVFYGCSKDDDPNLSLASISATYRGEFTIKVPPAVDADTISDVDIVITYDSGKDSAILRLDLINLNLTPVSYQVSVACAITSTKDNYSLSGEKAVSIPDMGNIGVKVENSSEVDKSGKATVNITATMPTQAGPMQIPVKFEGQKR
ncbi:MAG: hypothetical protein LBK96_00700 [Prevotellaceae bacterium]|nr:hypothetical protein [Prevotellaceae bacterium]